MNYNETMDHLTNEIVEQEQCSRTKAHQVLADALNARAIHNTILFRIAHRRCCFADCLSKE